MAARTWQESNTYPKMAKWVASDPDGFYELTVIVEGALSIGEYILTTSSLAFRIAEVATEARADGLETEVYYLWHSHAPDLEECACVQYLPDLKPVWTFPADLEHFTTS